MTDLETFAAWVLATGKGEAHPSRRAAFERVLDACNECDGDETTFGLREALQELQQGARDIPARAVYMLAVETLDRQRRTRFTLGDWPDDD